MDDVRLTSESRFALYFAMAGLAFFLGGCGLVGWYVGGRPPGWVEGKHLLAPVLVNGLFAMVPASVGFLMSVAGVWRAGLSRARRVRDWLPAGFAGAVVAALLANLAFPWGFAVVYLVSRTRQAFWTD